jgi:hypothetical protein
VTIHGASHQQQKDGIDRVWETSSGCRITVEYKGDWVADTTDNMFFETVSVDTAGKLGWCYTSLAQYLAYCIPPRRIIFFLPMSRIKRNLAQWVGRYQQVSVPNTGRRGVEYRTLGVLVPIEEFITNCTPEVITIVGKWELCERS